MAQAVVATVWSNFYVQNVVVGKFIDTIDLKRVECKSVGKHRRIRKRCIKKLF